MSHCLMTDGCCFISYTVTTSECVRHRKWKGYKSGISSSFWNPLTEDGCPCGWYKFQTSCFLIPDVQLSWHDSKEYCQKLDAKLAELDTEPKDVFVVDLIKKGTEKRTWIGGSDIDKEGSWTWSTSGSLLNITHQNWAKDQPNNQPVDSDCLCIGTWYRYRWDDNTCTYTGAFVCEKTVRNRPQYIKSHALSESKALG
ncbi:perlucin-like protein [Pecten maximus]|uniref:perlucin-like protein n=1 Tax=Pecten maximus TaxID=6579 RepID=UPI001458A9B5|nr:perlucin-like protein [Pecten maximus]